MGHKIVMKNTSTDWNEALGQGNGVFGCMSFFKDNKITCALNHYEVYYTMYERYSHSYLEKLKKGELTFGEPRSYGELLKAAEGSIRDVDSEEYLNYQRIIWPQTAVKKRPTSIRGTSHPATGEIHTQLSDEFKTSKNTRLELDIESASLNFFAKTDDKQVDIHQIVLSDADAVLTEYEQSEAGCIKKISFKYPLSRGHEGFSYEFTKKDNRTILCTVKFYPDGEDRDSFEPFELTAAVRLVSAHGEVFIDESEAGFVLDENTENKFSVITAVQTQLTSKNTLTGAYAYVQKIEKKIVSHKNTHKKYWKDFCNKSRINIPDKFLERLWYYNLYLLECCSGRDGKRKEQASGLNGIWDIKQPTIWGSLWYWDVNIQASYWPVYTANRMELARVFNDGFLSYKPFAKLRAEKFYNMPGVAMDYPHVFYNCMWPWCAQFLWWYYEYTGDKAFLKNSAYPMFVDILKFAMAFSKRDDNGKVVIFPDVSPEQGPLTKNSVITIATLKYLCKIAIKSAEILNLKDATIEEISEFLKAMPEYQTGEFKNYGEIMKDSQLAPVGIKLRHPSLLMPIFPIGEISMHSDDEKRKLAERTLNFAEDNTELGVFGYGWLSCAASRLGKGDTAIRLLYEKGLDLILRSNGMGAEETERFINHCCVEKPPYYYPFMMECIGETAAAINEMLMQSYDGKIAVFPAVPKGEREVMREAYKLISEKQSYSAWDECSFEGLLAKGGFLVSAMRSGKKTKYVKITSTRGGRCRIYTDNLPENWQISDEDGQKLFVSKRDGYISFDTEKSKSYIIESDLQYAEEEIGNGNCLDMAECDDILVHTAHTGRRVFIGKDSDTDYIKTLDSFLKNYYVANEPRRRMTTYRFKFGKFADDGKCLTDSSRTDYDTAFMSLDITPQRDFSVYEGYGFTEHGNIKEHDSMMFDALRRSNLSSDERAVFSFELLKGRYDILVICGDALKDSDTIIKSPDGSFNEIRRKLKKGEFKAVIIPVVQYEDGVFKLCFDTEGSEWSVCAVLVNKDFTNL